MYLPPPKRAQAATDDIQPQPPSIPPSSNPQQPATSTSSDISDDPATTARRVDRLEVTYSTTTSTLSKIQKQQSQNTLEIDKLTATVHDKLTEVIDFCKHTKGVMVTQCELVAAMGAEVVELRTAIGVMDKAFGILDEKLSGEVRGLREEIYKNKWEGGNRDEKIARMEREVGELRRKVFGVVTESLEERSRRIRMLERLSMEEMG